MGEYVWTTMEIGGEITGAVSKLLQALIEESGLEDRDDVREADEKSRPAAVAGTSNYGNLDDFEAFCRENKLAYRHTWAAQPGCFESGMKFWFPDMDKPEEHDATDDGEPALSAKWLQDQMKAGKTLAEVMAPFERALAPIPPLVLTDAAPASEEDDSSDSDRNPILVDRRERDTIIAALRLWQALDEGQVTFRDPERQRAIYEIAMNGRDGPGCFLVDDEIDALIESRINA